MPIHDSYRICKNCGFKGYMKPWLRTVLPRVLAVGLLCTGIVPGIVFLLATRDILQCPRCGKLR